jgi:hypothetical protein
MSQTEKCTPDFGLRRVEDHPDSAAIDNDLNSALMCGCAD